MDDRTPCNLTVFAFCQRAKALLEVDQASFVRFCLTGIHDNEQATIDAISNAIDEEEPISVRRDYDSVLGIDRSILPRAALTMYPVSRKEDTLAANIHLRYQFQSSRVGFLHF